MGTNDDDVDIVGVSARVPIAGVGASAGGVHALLSFFSALPPRLGIAFVVIVHLDPNHPSELAAVLARSTSMRVMQIDRRLEIEPDTVYVIPPDRRLVVSDGAIETAGFDEPRGQRAPIDMFFRSMAEQRGDGFAIVLSGSGSDGALGVRAVREKGGLILVQDPDEAEYNSMPRSAIASGADFVLPLKQLAEKMAELARNTAQLPEQTVDQGDDEELLRQILNLLRVRTGQDFSHYKRATMTRRMARRMQVTQTKDLKAYFAYLRDHGEETQALFNNLLISVTSFFRDPDAYSSLATECACGWSDAPAARRRTRSRCCCWRRPHGAADDRRSRCLPPTLTARLWPRRDRAAIRAQSSPTFRRSGCGATSCPRATTSGFGARCETSSCSRCTAWCGTRPSRNSISSPAAT